MANYPHLNSKEIYPVLIEDGFLVYSPLSEHFFLSGENDVMRMEQYAETGMADDDVKELVDTLLAAQTANRVIAQKNDISQIHKLTILPNYTCNFKCSYCYSAEGRSSKKIEKETALAAIDFFINKERTTLNELWLAILGGGEPFLSIGVVSEIIKYARCRAHEQGFKLGIGLTTNGSIYNRGLSKIMIENHVSLGVSFEVLEDIQNLQRQDYRKVCAVIDQYLSDGVDVSVKSIITPQNVNRLVEMVEHLHLYFSEIKKYKLQIVEDASLFDNEGMMRAFYAQFSASFFEAEEKGKMCGIEVYVLASKYIDALMEHYCGGEMCVTPDGSITICHRISSPQEKGYQDFVYGKISKNGCIHINHEKFKTLIAHDMAYNPKCKDCFVKWHCGGGCFVQSYIYSDKKLDIICDWTRNFTKQILLNRMAENVSCKK
jgi:radical SAM protein with 4Fe4S-binding SPASM domain